jgi:hypothetical protein
MEERASALRACDLNEARSFGSYQSSLRSSKGSGLELQVETSGANLTCRLLGSSAASLCIIKMKHCVLFESMVGLHILLASLASWIEGYNEILCFYGQSRKLEIRKRYCDFRLH